MCINLQGFAPTFTIYFYCNLLFFRLFSSELLITWQRITKYKNVPLCHAVTVPRHWIAQATVGKQPVVRSAAVSSNRPAVANKANFSKYWRCILRCCLAAYQPTSLPACLLLVATSSAHTRFSQTQGVVRLFGIFPHINLANAQWGGEVASLRILAISFAVSMHTFQKLIFHLVGLAC